MRATFILYLEDRALLPVRTEIQRRQRSTKRWTTQAGRVHAGSAFAQKDVMAPLTNQIYAGKVHYQGQSYPASILPLSRSECSSRSSACSRKTSNRSSRCAVATGTRAGAEAPTQVVNPLEPSSRIATLLALALKFEGLIHQGVIRDYAELARLGADLARPRHANHEPPRPVRYSRRDLGGERSCGPACGALQEPRCGL